MENQRGKGIGKIFEEEIKKSFPTDYYIERYKDDTAGFYGVSNPADYRIYKYPLLILLELKTHKGKSLPISKIRPNQLTGMAKAVMHKGVYGGFIVNFRDLEETYYIGVNEILVYINSTEKKSIPVEWFRDNAVRIEQEKKRVRYSYNLSKWLGGYFNG